MHSIAAFALVAAITLFFVHKIFKRSKVSNAPILNIDPSDNLGLDEQELYVKNIRKLLEKGYKTYSCRGISYVLDTPVGKQMVVAPKLIDEVQRLPDSIASNAHANELIMQFRHTLDGRLMHDHFHVDMPIKKLTNSLGPKLPDIVEEAQLAIDKFIGSPTEWTPHKIMPLSFNIVTRTANRLLFGTQLTRNDDFLKLSTDYTTIMFGAANRIRNYPELLKPIILRLSTNIKQAQAEARRHLIPVIESRLKQMKEYCEAGRAEYWDKIKPDDAIQWVLDAAPPDGMDPKILVFRMLHINIAAVHTSTVSFVDIVQVLAMMPDIQTELREEIQSEFLKGGGWSKQGLMHLRKLDSFMKEVARFYVTSAVKVKRVALRDFTLSDGTIVPKGIILCFDHKTHVSRNEALPHALEFDPWRSYRQRQEAGQENMHQFVISTTTNLTFGLGRHACPGRFFAVNEIKTLLVLILMKFDIRMNLPGGLPEIFEGTWYNEARSPIIYGILDFKVRQASIPETIAHLF